MIVIETLVVVGKPYDSSEHPAASVLLNEILGSNDCAGLNGAERWPLEAALIHNTGWVSPRLIPGPRSRLSDRSSEPIASVFATTPCCGLSLSR
jgi:hypothetical protein